MGAALPRGQGLSLRGDGKTAGREERLARTNQLLVARKDCASLLSESSKSDRQNPAPCLRIPHCVSDCPEPGCLELESLHETVTNQTVIRRNHHGTSGIDRLWTGGAGVPRAGDRGRSRHGAGLRSRAPWIAGARTISAG